MPGETDPPPQRQAPRYDAVIKDIFQRDRPTLAQQLRGGVAVRASLNVEFATVEEARADLVWLLADDTILHIEFQSDNDADMPYRIGSYGLAIGRKYRCRLRQVVIFIGNGKLTMPDAVDLGDIQVRYRLVDLRTFDAGDLIASGRPGDLVLAMLAGGGTRRLHDILTRAAELDAVRSDRVLAQLLVLSGLRKLSSRLTIEVKRMGMTIDIEKNAFLREVRDTAREEGREQGLEEGIGRGAASSLRLVLEHKFGPLPRWALPRINNASVAQINKFIEKALHADSLEAVIGRR